MANPEHGFVGFEYLEVSAKRSMESMYVDGYRNFGWEFEGASAQEAGSGAVRLKFKRDRRIPSKAELTRLQRQFEACALEIEALERSKTTAAAIAAFTIGLAGSAFLGGAVFAYLNGLLPLMVILAVPGFLGWIASAIRRFSGAGRSRPRPSSSRKTTRSTRSASRGATC